jgi:AraC family transcriptional regulator of adaptative response/methylated-DNA-[protein]-cysteine methyltransferase
MSKNRVGEHGGWWQDGSVNEYEVVAKVIRHLDQHHEDQPDLAELAEVAELSPFHFHRLFSSWAGVTPKDFVQCLTLRKVRGLLEQGASVLGAALDAGMSGPGRVHDLCVTLEAASPGEIKSGGAGWTIEAGGAATPFGRCLVARNHRGICHLSFVDGAGEAASWARMQAEWPNAQFRRDDVMARRVVGEMFVGHGVDASHRRLRAFVRGTAFQVRVWRALLEVPPGRLTSYGRVAAALGQPKASRAVGTAVGDNPVAYLIPCHRVIRETGIVGEYRWGAVRKRAMLAWESAREIGASGATLAMGRFASQDALC